MPKHEIHHNAGELAPEEIKELLLRYFDEKEISRLERLGGRILISLTSPYRPRKGKNNKKITIEENFIKKLHEYKDRPLELKSHLDQLSVKQLIVLGKLLEHPLRTKSSRHELLDEIVAHFYSEEVWRKIVNTS